MAYDNDGGRGHLPGQERDPIQLSGLMACDNQKVSEIPVR